jgi:hypothetical protein
MGERVDMDQTKFPCRWVERKRITMYVIEREEIKKKRPLSTMQIVFACTESALYNIGVSMGGYIRTISLTNKWCILLLFTHKDNKKCISHKLFRILRDESNSHHIYFGMILSLPPALTVS